jgi:hypothetical protein
MEQAHAFTFDAFRLEPPPGGLCRGDTVIALRPRSLAVLRYLVRHAGRLVTKAELRQHVWGGTHVSDTVLMKICDQAPTRRNLRVAPNEGLSFLVLAMRFPLPLPWPEASSTSPCATLSNHDARAGRGQIHPYRSQSLSASAVA